MSSFLSSTRMTRMKHSVVWLVSTPYPAMVSLCSGGSGSLPDAGHLIVMAGNRMCTTPTLQQPQQKQPRWSIVRTTGCSSSSSSESRRHGGGGLVVLHCSARCMSSGSSSPSSSPAPVGFSSAVFTGDRKALRADEAEEAKVAAAKARLRALHNNINSSSRSGQRQALSNNNNNNNNNRNETETTPPYDARDTFTYTPGEEHQFDHLSHPTIETYKAMSDEELATLLRTREAQVLKLRQIYEQFHYEVDKHFRLTVLDYHDKALQLSQVHGQMQHNSLRINREALTKLREEQEMLTRDKRLVMFLCVLFTLGFWVWTRRHYIRREELEGAVAGRGGFGDHSLVVPSTAEALDETRGEGSVWQQQQNRTEKKADGTPSHYAMQGRVAPSVTGPGFYGGGNWFGSEKRSARYRETAWEREQRERAEQQQQQQQQQEQQAATGTISSSSP